MKVIIGVSNRHVHLNDEDYKILFGNTNLEKKNDLKQIGEFASTLQVTLKTDKNIIDRVRVMGPLRNYTQVEISKTDSYFFGINPPIRDSGNLKDAETITIVGPEGKITKNCCIIPTRHIHINKEKRKELGLGDMDNVTLYIGKEKKAFLEDVHLKETENGVLEVHIDTDDANSNFIKTGDYGMIFSSKTN